MPKHSRQPIVWLIALVTLLICLMSTGGRAEGTSPDGGAETVDTAWVGNVDEEALRKIEPALLQSISASPEGSHQFIVHMQEDAKPPEESVLSALDRLSRRRAVVETLRGVAERSQSDLIRFLSGEQAAQRAQAVQPFWVFNGLAVTAQPETILQIAARKDVRAVYADHIRYLSDPPIAPADVSETSSPAGPVEWNIASIRADQVWNALNLTGEGIVVANMDTGVDWLHPALYANYRGNVGHGVFDHATSWFCATNEGYSAPFDSYGHGTHTMGTIAGYSADHTAIGVAPRAKWIAVKIFSDKGLTYDSWIHAGFQWVLNPGDSNDPALVPDVVNNSWGSSIGDDVRFRPDVQAWRAAGIPPIFSAGNDGPLYDTVGAPGSYPESITSGATTMYGYVAYFSSRGPSVWGIKPDLTAPGVDIVSSFPEGRYATASGTSMAAPHVAGAYALALQAAPSLSVDETEDILTSTAVRRGFPIPNNEFGWGELDAYQTVATALGPGSLQGSVRRSTDNKPIANAEILAQRFLPEQGSGQTISDSQGAYHLPLAAWMYDVSVSAFGYQPASISYVEIVTGTTQTRDFSLIPLATGQVTGRVLDLGSGGPLSATLVISGTPVTAMTVPATGQYSVDLPAGRYTIRVESERHQIAWAYDVTVNTGETTEQDFALAEAPRILLVDSGAWHQGSQAIYFQQALDDLNYLYDRRTIYQIYGQERSVPTADELAPYDIVIWSCPADSPGYVGAWEALAEYLDSGGKLFITGQNVGFWDQSSGWFSSPEYGQYLQARFVRDDSGSESIAGINGGLLEGLTITLNGEDSADNQDSPDEITRRDETKAAVVARYEGDGYAALQVEACVPYQAVYFGFGFEGISQRETRREVMQRIIDVFTAVPEPVTSYLAPSWQNAIRPAGDSITYTLQVHNLNPNGLPDTYSLTGEGNNWPSTLLSNTVSVAACDLATVSVRIDIPPGTVWGATDVFTVYAHSAISPTIRSSAVISTNTPAPILLVDDDRWYDMEAYYTTALEQNGLPYDYWRVGWRVGETAQGSPTAQTLQMYPMVVWFTGYDWAFPLTAQDEQRLAASLDTGTNLLLISQDYLSVRHVNSFGQNYLGIAAYEEITTTQVSGVKDNAITNQLASYPLVCTHGNRSHIVTPTEAQGMAFEGDHEQAVGLTHTESPFRSAFLPFLFEGITPEAGRRETLRQLAGWISWLGASTFDTPHAAPSGATITCTLTLNNSGWQPISAHAINALPPALDFEPGSLSPPEAIYENGTRTITWDRTLDVGEHAQLRYRAVISSAISAATPITNVFEIGYAEHQIEYALAHVTDVDAPDLSASSLSVDQVEIERGDTLTYTIVARNDGLSAAASVTLTNPVPAYTDYVTGSLRQEGTHSATDSGGTIAWEGALAAGESITLTYQATASITRTGITIHNVAYVWDHYHARQKLTADTYISPGQIWLPLIFKDYGG